jgi:hypothetical protein
MKIQGNGFQPGKAFRPGDKAVVSKAPLKAEPVKTMGT